MTVLCTEKRLWPVNKAVKVTHFMLVSSKGNTAASLIECLLAKLGPKLPIRQAIAVLKPGTVLGLWMLHRHDVSTSNDLTGGN